MVAAKNDKGGKKGKKKGGVKKGGNFKIRVRTPVPTRPLFCWHCGRSSLDRLINWVDHRTLKQRVGCVGHTTRVAAKMSTESEAKVCSCKHDT